MSHWATMKSNLIFIFHTPKLYFLFQIANYQLRKQIEKITDDPPEESEENLVDDWDDDNPDYDPKNNKKPDSQISSMYVKMTMNLMFLLLMTIICQVHLPKEKEGNKQVLHHH